MFIQRYLDVLDVRWALFWRCVLPLISGYVLSFNCYLSGPLRTDDFENLSNTFPFSAIPLLMFHHPDFQLVCNSLVDMINQKYEQLQGILNEDRHEVGYIVLFNVPPLMFQSENFPLKTVVIGNTEMLLFPLWNFDARFTIPTKKWISIVMEILTTLQYTFFSTSRYISYVTVLVVYSSSKLYVNTPIAMIFQAAPRLLTKKMIKSP